MKITMKVLPASLWLSYGARDPAALQKLVPPHLRVARCRLLGTDGRPAYRLLFNAYEVRGAFMNGHRIDIQTFAVDRATRTPHLVILDCVTNTLDWNPVSGVTLGDGRFHGSDRRAYSLCANSSRGGLLVDGALGEKRPIDRTFAIDANRRCFYGTDAHGLDMTFDEAEVGRGVRLLRRPRVENTLWRAHRRAHPTHVFVHEHPMTFHVHDWEW